VPFNRSVVLSEFPLDENELYAREIVEPPWSEWVKVADWLDGTGRKPRDDEYGVYRFRVRAGHQMDAETLLYIGSTQKSGKVGKGVDNFTGLRRRMWQFISSALGFGMATNPGCGIGQPKLSNVSARDLEASWAVVDCPSCVEHEQYHRASFSLNKKTPSRCKREGCPRSTAFNDWRESERRKSSGLDGKKRPS
jgi:hypothetical protein